MAVVTRDNGVAQVEVAAAESTAAPLKSAPVAPRGVLSPPDASTPSQTSSSASQRRRDRDSKLTQPKRVSLAPRRLRRQSSDASSAGSEGDAETPEPPEAEPPAPAQLEAVQETVDIWSGEYYRPRPPTSDSESAALLRAALAVRQRAARAERPPKKRGAHAHPPLREELPSWKTCWPPKEVIQANDFDAIHKKKWDRAERAYIALSTDLTHLAKQGAFRHTHKSLARCRFKEPVELLAVKRYAIREAKIIKKVRDWKLQTSIWGTLSPAALLYHCRALLTLKFRLHSPRSAARQMGRRT